ncbi:GldG family protein [Azospirillum halopraeferens]|uniref:GldG family protein n=1 Tax=Azospirillum halopraeferens TaxID=34010 RepID=UPI0003FF6A20|nr:Gldg family protein [Azospirillum halopraeferens]
MTRKTVSLIALALAAVLFVAVNVLAQATLRNARLDLTADRLYTLSPGTLNVLAGVREPVTLRLYFSERLAGDVPALRTYGQRVRELLEEYEARSDGRVRLEVIDPEPYSDAEDRAVEAGITGVPLDRAGGRQVYFGLVGTNTIDGQEVIPFFQQEREAFLEYDLTRLVHALAQAKRPVVGVLTAMPLEYGPGGMMAAMRGGARPYAVLSTLRALFDVRMLQPGGGAIDPDIDVLVVARPRDLSPRTLYAIDQFVMGGGRALFFVDPWAESEAVAGPGGMPNPVADRAAALPELFDAWGIALEAGRFVADPQIAISVSTGRRTLPYAAWLAVGEAGRARDDVVTADLGVVNLASAGSLALKEGSRLTLTPLLTSSAAGRLVPVAQLMGRPEPEKLLAGLSGEGSRHVLAARLSGPLTSAFPDGPPRADDGEEGEAGDGEPPAPPAPHRASADGPANLIVVADSDLLEDRFWVEDQALLGQSLAMPFAGNGDFVLNAVENLAGSADLIALRGRAGSQRPFVLVQDLRREANREMLAREQELEAELRDTETRIAELQGKARAAAGPLLSAEEQAAIDRFRGEVVRIRKELRAVQHSLNRDIERLSATVKAVNIVAVPLAVALLAVVMAGWRAHRRARLVRE